MLSGLKCLVTGASSGIGKGTCSVLARHGAAIYGSGRNEESLRSMVADSVLVGYCVADLTAENECSRVVSSAVDALGGLTTGK